MIYLVFHDLNWKAFDSIEARDAFIKLKNINPGRERLVTISHVWTLADVMRKEQAKQRGLK